MCKVASLAGVEITQEDISTSHRIKTKSGNSKFPPAIIAKFITRDARDDLYKARGRLRNHSTKDLNLGRASDNSIYISESLTETNKKLFKSALSCRKEFKYRFIWTSLGRIYLRKDDSSPALLIRDEGDIAKLQQHGRDQQEPRQECPELYHPPEN